MLPSCGERLPFQGPIPPIRGKCPEGTKGIGMLSPKVTERLLHICGDLSVSASPSHPPGRGGLGERTPMASPMRGSCRRRRLMRWTAPRRRKCLHLIRHGFAVPPSPHRGRLWCSKNRKSPRKKVQPDKFRLHLLFTADILRQLLTNLMYRIRRRVPRRP